MNTGGAASLLWLPAAPDGGAGELDAAPPPPQALNAKQHPAEPSNSRRLMVDAKTLPDMIFSLPVGYLSKPPFALRSPELCMQADPERPAPGIVIPAIGVEPRAGPRVGIADDRRILVQQVLHVEPYVYRA